MRNLQKKIIWLLCLCLMISTLSACSPLEQTKEKPIVNTESESGETEKTTEPEALEQESTEALEQESTEASKESETESEQEQPTTEQPTEPSTTVPPTQGPTEPSTQKEPATEPLTQKETETQAPSKPELSAGEKLAKEIVDQIIKPGMSEFEKAITIHDWITYNIDYDFTYTHYYLEETLRDRTGVCQGYALAFQSMAEHAGLECAYVRGRADNGSGSGYEGHAWNCVRIDGIWYNVDTTWDDPASPGKDPSDHQYNNYGYFLISDAQINKDHIVTMIGANAEEAKINYNRATIYRYAINSGRIANAEFAETTDELAKVIDEKFKENAKDICVWYYNPNSTNDEQITEISNAAMAACTTLCVWQAGYYSVDDNMTRIYFVYGSTYSEWMSLKIVHNVIEMEAFIDEVRATGAKECKVRLEYDDSNIYLGGANEYVESYSIMYIYDDNYVLSIKLK